MYPAKSDFCQKQWKIEVRERYLCSGEEKIQERAWGAVMCGLLLRKTSGYREGSWVSSFTGAFALHQRKQKMTIFGKPLFFLLNCSLMRGGTQKQREATPKQIRRDGMFTYLVAGDKDFERLQRRKLK